MNREIDTKGEVYFELALMLPVGTYQYKYLVDGQWCYDNTQPFVPDSFGSYNNIVEIYPKKTFKNTSGGEKTKITSVITV